MHFIFKKWKVTWPINVRLLYKTFLFRRL